MIRNDTETGTLKHSSPSRSPVPPDHAEEKVSEIQDDDDNKDTNNLKAGKTQNTPFQDKKKLENIKSKNKKEVNKKMTETIKIYDDQLSDEHKLFTNKNFEEMKIRESNASILDQIHSI